MGTVWHAIATATTWALSLGIPGAILTVILISLGWDPLGLRDDE